MATQSFEFLGQGIGQPAQFPFNITPSDTAPLWAIARGIRVGTGGDLAVQRLDGVVVVIPDINAGETLPIMAKKIYATGTTASGITGYA